MTTINTLKPILLTLFILSLIASTFGQRVNTTITGRVIGENRQHTSRVVVTVIQSPCKNCIDLLVPSAESLPHGNFRIKWEFEEKENIRIYLEESLKESIFNPFQPIDVVLGQLDGFKGIEKEVPGSGVIDLGDVSHFYSYVPVRINMRTLNWSKCIGNNLWKDLSISVRLKDKIVIEEVLVDERDLDKKSGEFLMAFPIGTWILETSLPGNIACTEIEVGSDRKYSVSKMSACR